MRSRFVLSLVVIIFVVACPSFETKTQYSYSYSRTETKPRSTLRPNSNSCVLEGNIGEFEISCVKDIDRMCINGGSFCANHVKMTAQNINLDIKKTDSTHIYGFILVPDSLNIEIQHFDGSSSYVTVSNSGKRLKNRSLKQSACLDVLVQFVSNKSVNFAICGVEELDKKEEDFNREGSNLRLDSYRGLLSRKQVNIKTTNSVDIDGILIGVQGIILSAPNLKITGHIIAGTAASITCEQCDFSQAHFFGVLTWDVNGKECQLSTDEHRLVCQD